MLEVDAPKGNPKEAWERIRRLIAPLPPRFPEKLAQKTAYLIALEYNIGLETWCSSNFRREAAAIAKHAGSLATALGNLSTSLGWEFYRFGTRKPEVLRAANIQSNSSLTKRLPDRNNKPIGSWRSRLYALAALADMVAVSKQHKVRKIPSLKEELAFDCLCFLAACGKTARLKRGGDLAELAAAELEWATGAITIANQFDGQMDGLLRSRRDSHDYFGAGVWDADIRHRSGEMVRGEWPLENK